MIDLFPIKSCPQIVHIRPFDYCLNQSRQSQTKIPVIEATYNTYAYGCAEVNNERHDGHVHFDIHESVDELHRPKNDNGGCSSSFHYLHRLLCHFHQSSYLLCDKKGNTGYKYQSNSSSSPSTHTCIFRFQVGVYMNIE